MKALIVVVPLSFMISSCALDPYHLGDPTKMASAIPVTEVPTITKSLKCEIITFETENRIRQDIQTYYSVHDKNIFSNLVQIDGSVPLDPNGYTYVALDIKNINTGNFSLGYDWNKPTTFVKPARATLGEILDSREMHNYHVGPSYVDTGTFEYTTTLGIPQNDLLGNATVDNEKVDYAGIFQPPQGRQSPDDKNNPNCYDNLSDLWADTQAKEISTDRKSQAQHAIQSLVANDDTVKSHVKFQRIFVGAGNQTLASWLEYQAKLAEDNTRPTLNGDMKSETMILGQMSYQFTLDAKPGLDMSMKLIAGYADPLFPDASLSQEHSANFQLFMNTASAFGIGQSKSGNARPKEATPEAVYIVKRPANKKPGAEKHFVPGAGNQLELIRPIQPTPKSPAANPFMKQQVVPIYPYVTDPTQ